MKGCGFTSEKLHKLFVKKNTKFISLATMRASDMYAQSRSEDEDSFKNRRKIVSIV